MLADVTNPAEFDPSEIIGVLILTVQLLAAWMVLLAPRLSAELFDIAWAAWHGRWFRRAPTPITLWFAATCSSLFLLILLPMSWYLAGQWLRFWFGAEAVPSWMFSLGYELAAFGIALGFAAVWRRRARAREARRVAADSDT